MVLSKFVKIFFLTYDWRMDIKNIIADLINLGYTQKEIAEVANMTQGRISQILKAGECSDSSGQKIRNLHSQEFGL